MKERHSRTVPMRPLLLLALLATPLAAQRSADRTAEWVVDTRFTVSDDVLDQLAQVTTMAVTPTGRLVILDGRSASIIVLDERGKMVARFGRAGRGPGELVAATVQSLTVTNDGDVWVPQAGLRRIDRFNLDGKYLGALPFVLPLPVANRAVWQAGGTLAYWTMTATREQTIVVYDPAQEKVTWSQAVIRHSAEPPRPLGLVLGPSVAWCASPDGTVYFGRTDSATLSVRRTTGGATPFVTLPVASRAPSARAAAHVRALEEARRSRATPTPQALPPIELPATVPLFASIICSRNGDVWVQQFPPLESLTGTVHADLNYAAAESRDWTRYGSTGNVEERVRIPANVVVHSADAEYLYGVQSEESGEFRVVRLRRRTP